MISSPYAKRGELYQTYKRDWGAKGDPLVLVAKGASKIFNSTLEERVVDRAYRNDPAVAAAEWGAEFRNDVVGYIDREVVEACVSRGIRERGYIPTSRYKAFVDPSGGSNDSMTMAIGHTEGQEWKGTRRIVVDAIRERRPPFSPEQVVEEFCETLRSYGCTKVTGDRYAGEWPREQFRKHGVEYEIAPAPKSDLYRDMLPVLNSGKADLLDNDKLVDQIAGLERRVARGGRESIDHAPNNHDDIANAVAGLIKIVHSPGYDPTGSWIASAEEMRDMDAGVA